ncbi:MAG: hypothetical protein IMZ53_10410 [Thermoplasmata archaeon]|nr:hypothetical protein [Thermoplasmata archaeon]
MSLAILGKKTFWAFLIVLILVWIPYGLSKLKISNEYITFLTNPFFVFFIMLFVLGIYLYKFFKPTVVSLVILAGMFAAAFIYVYIFYIM